MPVPDLASAQFSGHAPHVQRPAPPVTGPLEQRLPVVMFTVVAALILYKFFLVQRLNINWDEFFYLNHVHAVSRGDGGPLLQRFQTHLFGWLTSLQGDEIRQIAAARSVMVGLLALTTWLVWRLGRIWLHGFAASIPPFVYIASVPVMVHGGSFRADSLLAPLTVAALLFLFLPHHSRARDAAAGAALGLAFAITIKTALAAPLVLAALAARTGTAPTQDDALLRRLVSDSAWIASVAAISAATLIAFHWMAIGNASVGSTIALGTSSASRTLVEVPWFPRGSTLLIYADWQPLFWCLLFVGAIAALLSRRFDVASLGLALLPVAFYRNAFPYYYVVMLAPASILAGYAVQQVIALVRPKVSNWVTSALLATIWIGLLYQGLGHTSRLMVDDQMVQRMLLSGIHRIFPEPVNYVDRCGMVPTFRKVNFFMSTWGMENYRRRGEPFLPSAIRDHQPAFVLVNAPALNPKTSGDRGLLPRDRELIANYYPRYWGPVRVAGAKGTVGPSESVTLHVPFADRYRIEATAPIKVDGMLRRDGDVIDVPASGVVVQAPTSSSTSVVTSVTLFLAAAAPPPADELPLWPLFTGL